MIGGAVDREQAPIVAALRAAGYTVRVCSDFARGFPDLAVFHSSCPALTLLVEVKNEPRYKLTPAQVKFHSTWPGPLMVAWNAGMVVERFALLRRQNILHADELTAA